MYNFRVIPDQNQVLIVRNIERTAAHNMKNSHTALELYVLPEPGENRMSEAIDWKILDNQDYINVQISETYRKMPTHEDDSITPYLSQDHIQPISIYLRTELSMIHYAMYPYSVDPPPSPPDTPSSQEKGKGKDIKPPRRKWIYDLMRSINLDFTLDDILDIRRPYRLEKYETREEYQAAERGEWTFPVKPKYDDSLRFLPGSSRCVFYQIPRRWTSIDPPVTAIFGYQINERDRTFFDYVAHMKLSDAITIGDIFNVQEHEFDAGAMTDEQREEAEVACALASIEWRKKNAYIHPSLQVPTKTLEKGRENMTSMDLSTDFINMMGHGVHAMCFDEDVGRLVVATKADKKLHVFDFAHTRSRGERIRQCRCGCNLTRFVTDDEDHLLTGQMEMAIDYETELSPF